MEPSYPARFRGLQGGRLRAHLKQCVDGHARTARLALVLGTCGCEGDCSVKSVEAYCETASAWCAPLPESSDGLEEHANGPEWSLHDCGAWLRLSECGKDNCTERVYDAETRELVAFTVPDDGGVMAREVR